MKIQWPKVASWALFLSGIGMIFVQLGQVMQGGEPDWKALGLAATTIASAFTPSVQSPAK